MTEAARLVDELTTLLYSPCLGTCITHGPDCRIVVCGACRRKADKPESVVHESDCPVYRLIRAEEANTAAIRANAEEIADLEDKRDDLEAQVNALTAERDGLQEDNTALRWKNGDSYDTWPLARLREPEYFKVGDRELEKTAVCRCCDFFWAWSYVSPEGYCLHCVDGRADLRAERDALTAERDAARAWSARWKDVARRLSRAARKQAREHYTSWQRACDDTVRLAAERDALRARAERAESALDGWQRLAERLAWHLSDQLHIAKFRFKAGGYGPSSSYGDDGTQALADFRALAPEGMTVPRDYEGMGNRD